MKTLRFLGKGIGHEDSEKDCQDRLSVLMPENENNIFAISDGCSSSKYAEAAAQCNIDVINKVFSRCCIQDLNRDSFVELYPMLEQQLSSIMEDDIVACFSLVFMYEMSCTAKKIGLANADNSDFYATLLFAIVEKEKTMVGHIGDGNIIFFDEEGNIVFRSAEDNGIDSSHTYFTIGKNFIEHFNLDVIETESFCSLILFSDGPQSMFKLECEEIAKGAYEIVVNPVAKGQIKTEQELAQKLQQTLANAMHYGFDDWSIIVAKKDSESNTLNDIQPLSLKQMFFEEYNKTTTTGTAVDSEPTNDDNIPTNDCSETSTTVKRTSKLPFRSNGNSIKNDCKNCVIRDYAIVIRKYNGAIRRYERTIRKYERLMGLYIKKNK